MTGPYIESITDKGSGSAGRLGGKGMSLQRLAGWGFRVPEAFVVTADAYRQALAGSLGAKVDFLASTIAQAANPDELAATASTIRSLLYAETRDHLAEAAVRRAYAELAAQTGDDTLSVAVRSSSTAEDSAALSFAGGHDTLLWVSSAADVSDAVRRCWASLYSARAVAYRRHTGHRGRAAMAVVVQRMVNARAAGVFATLNPANGDRSKIVIESVWGLGEPLMSGTATPDRFVVDKVTGEIVDWSLARKEFRVSRDPRTGRGVRTLTVAEGDVARASLSAAELIEIVSLARSVERRAGCPQDAEFAVSESGTYLLQARPETVWSRRVPARATHDSTALSHMLNVLTDGSSIATQSQPTGSADRRVDEF